MTHKITLTATSIVLSTLLLTGCGGGSSSGSDDETKEVTGQFIDTYVEGLNYTCSSGTKGVTNSEGEYTCNEGDTVEFSLGEYILGSATASSGIVTPVTLYPEDADAALNVAQLLQTLDSDSDDGIITIPEDFSDLDDVAVTPEDDAFDETMEEELDEPLVSEEDAQEHMDEALSSNLTALLSGKTLYTTIYNQMGTLESWTFNESITTSVWKELVGGTETGTGSVMINSMTITFTAEEESATVVVTEILEDYMLVIINGGEAQRLYFDESKARAYFLSSASSTSLVGSWYGGDASHPDNIVTLTFFENGSYVFLQDGNNLDGSCSNEDCYDGMERGTYSWNASNGTFSATALTDTNGEWGLSHPSQDFTVTIDKNTLTMIDEEDTYTVTRVENIANSIVGSWYGGDASQPDNIVTLTFFENGSYVFLQDGNNLDGSCSNEDCYDGIERGTYSWDASNGTFSSTTLTDTNGEWGLSHSNSMNITINNNTLTIRDEEGTHIATRIE